MASAASSPSEGEIFESDSEKAHKSLPSVNGTKVDRPTRIPSPPGRSPPPVSPRPRLSRSRSRSPYRAPRGEKRPREDDYSDRNRADARRFNARYDEPYRKDQHRRQTSYHDLDRGSSSRTYLPYDDDLDRRHNSKRPRTRSRSRSPYRHGGKQDRPRYQDREGPRRENDSFRRRDQGSRGYRDSDRSRNEQSVSERDRVPSAAHSSKHNTETRGSQGTHDAPTSSSGRVTEGIKSDTNGIDTTAPQKDSDASGPVDEAALIEERRRRREAIKAKYGPQATPLLVQALHINNDTAVSTPGQSGSDPPSRKSESPRPSPQLASPQTPQVISGMQSPTDFEVSRDEDLVNDITGVVEEEEPSAADYDPTVDMQEDRLRHDKRLMNEDVPASAYDETQTTEQEVVISDHIQEAPLPKAKDPFDMFAEDDDDDDMFAEPARKPATAVQVQPSKAQPQALDMSMMDNWDDPEGYYLTIPGELIEGRYHVQQNLGKGMFSSVVRAIDSVTNKLVAIKIVRNNETMRKAGLKEIEILKGLANADPEDKKHVIRLERSFDHKGHLCMVFENLSMNLREVLKKFGRDVGINLKAIRAYAQQLFLGLSLLRKGQILHADLKPDNVLVNEARNVLKICDLGSASPIDENVTAPYLVSRFYRAPEIILGIPYDYAIDTWSIGCTLFELYTGKILFTGRNNNAMLKSIMECRGRFPHKLLRRGSLTHMYFNDLLVFQSVEEDKITGRVTAKMIDYKKPTRDLRSRLIGKGKKMEESERRELELFLDLLDKCLNLNPEKRCTPGEALKHPFITRGKV